MTKREQVIEWLGKTAHAPMTGDDARQPLLNALALIADLTAEVEAWRARKHGGASWFEDKRAKQRIESARTAVDAWDKEADRDPTTNIIGTCPKCGSPIAREYPTHYCGEGGRPSPLTASFIKEQEARNGEA